MALETKIEGDACDLVYKHLGISNSKLVTPGNTGFPDRIFWLPRGRPLLVEYKQPGMDPRPKQVYIHGQLKKLGYAVETHDNKIQTLEATIEIIRYFDTMETTRLSKKEQEILDRARSLCAVLRSRAG